MPINSLFFLVDSEDGRRGVRGTGRRSYRAGDNYGRRGVDSRYRGYDAMDDMYSNYDEYNEARESYNESGNYNAKDGMVRSAEGIMSNVYEIVDELSQTGEPEVMQVIKKYARKINEL